MNTTYFLNAVANQMFLEPPSSIQFYLGLSKTEPSLDGGGVTEPGANTGYIRTKIEHLSLLNNGVVTNTSDIMFDESTAEWGDMKYFVIFDALNAGNLLMFGKLSHIRRVEVATQVVVEAGTLNLCVTNPVG